MPSVRSVEAGTRIAPFSYRTALPLTQLEAPRGRHVYAGDAFCKVVRALGDITGAAALRLSGMPTEVLLELPLATRRTLPMHRAGALLGQGVGCLLGAVIGAAAWLNPVDAAHDVAARSTIKAAQTRAEDDLAAGRGGSWREDLLFWVEIAKTAHLPHGELVDDLQEELAECVENCAQGTRDGRLPLGEAALGLVLTERALAQLSSSGAPGERAMREALQRAHRGYAAQARQHAVVACRDGRSGALYHGDSPTLLRAKCALLAITAPVVASVNVLLTMAARGRLAARAACVEGDLRKALVQTAWGLSAPLLGAGLQLTALAGVLAPNLGRKLYARVEARMAWTTAPCFIPREVPRRPVLARAGMARAGMARPVEAHRHGLGGLAVEGGHI